MSLTNEQIVDAVAGKTLMEVMELVKAIEEKFGVTAAAPVMMAGPAADAARVEERTEFTPSKAPRRPSRMPCRRTMPRSSRKTWKPLARRSKSSKRHAVIPGIARTCGVPESNGFGTEAGGFPLRRE